VPRTFFESLPYNGLNQAFAFFKVAGWLIQHQAGADVLFHQQELVVALNDSCNGDIGFKGHTLNYRRPTPEKM
jgi:hypothetical protein